MINEFSEKRADAVPKKEMKIENPKMANMSVSHRVSALSALSALKMQQGKPF